MPLPPNAAGSSTTHSAIVTVADWMREFLMRSHPDLGREGHVCPFTSQAGKIDTIRIGADDAGPKDMARLRHAMSHGFATFDSIACPPAARRFRALLLALPNCTGPDGFAAMKAVQRQFQHQSVFKGKMIAACHELSDDPGVINPRFRPLRSPVPLMVIREMVDGDAPFVLRNTRITPIYLLKFRLRGLRLLLRAWRTRQ